MKFLIFGINSQDAKVFINNNKLNQKDYFGVSHTKTKNSFYWDYKSSKSIENIISSLKPDVILYFAAYHKPSTESMNNEIEKYMKTNFKAYEIVLNSALNKSKNSIVINLFSSKMYTPFDNDLLVTEESIQNPSDNYGISNVLAFKLSEYYRLIMGAKIINLITFNHESEYRKSNFFSSYLVDNVIKCTINKNHVFSINNIGACADFIDAYDVIRVIEFLIHKKEFNKFIISSGIKTSVFDLCSFLFDKYKLDMEQHLDIKNNLQIPCVIGDNRKILNENFIFNSNIFNALDRMSELKFKSRS